MSITYDLKKKFNAQSTLKGNKVDVFHETNPSVVKNKRYENYSLPVRGLTELTREGEVPVWGVESHCLSVLEVIPNRHVHVTYMRLGTILMDCIGLNWRHKGRRIVAPATQGWDGSPTGRLPPSPSRRSRFRPARTDLGNVGRTFQAPLLPPTPPPLVY